VEPKALPSDEIVKCRACGAQNRLGSKGSPGARCGICHTALSSRWRTPRFLVPAVAAVGTIALLVALASGVAYRTVRIDGKPATVKVNRYTGSADELIRDRAGNPAWRSLERQEAQELRPAFPVDPMDLEVVETKTQGRFVQLTLRNKGSRALSEVHLRIGDLPRKQGEFFDDIRPPDPWSSFGTSLRPRTIVPRDGRPAASGETAVFQSFELPVGKTFVLVGGWSQP
jgi:hypothetical protein